MNQDKFIGEGLTFDDVLLVPDASDVCQEVDLTSLATSNITLNIP